MSPAENKTSIGHRSCFLICLQYGKSANRPTPVTKKHRHVKLIEEPRIVFAHISVGIQSLQWPSAHRPPAPPPALVPFTNNDPAAHNLTSLHPTSCHNPLSYEPKSYIAFVLYIIFLQILVDES